MNKTEYGWKLFHVNLNPHLTYESLHKNALSPLIVEYTILKLVLFKQTKGDIFTNSLKPII